MEVFFLPNEEMFLTFKMGNGSGWLTSHRLILCEHPQGHLEGHTPVIYSLKDFEKAQVKKSTLIVQFRGRQKAKMKLPVNNTALLQEIKQYIEKASLNHQTNNAGVE